MKRCWKCTKEVPEGSVTCPFCSVSLTDKAIDNMATVGPSEASTIQILPGVLVNDRYEIKSEIGRGGMGIVYLGHDRTMDQEIALKVIPQDICHDPKAVADLKRETGIALGLTQENIVRLYNLDTWEGQAYVTMEYVGGGTLAHVLAAKVKLSIEEALPYLRQIATALDYSHSTTPAIIHRDLKPLNILLTEDGRVKIADYGLARVLRDSATRVSGQDSSGTLSYMAPEQVRGKGIGKKTDLYSFAAIAYEMLSGTPPFHTGDLRWQIMHEEVEEIAEVAGYVNAALLQGLDKERENRPESASELVQLLAGEKAIGSVKKKLKKIVIDKEVIKQTIQQAFADKSNHKYFLTGLIVLVVAGGISAGGYVFNSEGDTVADKLGAVRGSFKTDPPLINDPTTGMELVLVKGGCYPMGDNFGDGAGDEKPVHNVCLDDFYLGKYELTQGQYEQIMGNNPSKFRKGSNYPVENVNWDDAQSYIERLNLASKNKYRLPTEAEWEYAARSGGQKEMYAGVGNVGAIAWYTKNSNSSTHPVGMKSANGLGLYDMSGNVWEWTKDYYDSDYYSKSSVDNPQGPVEGSRRVFRGGSWGNDAVGIQAAYRSGSKARSRYSGVGFRLVSSLSGK